MNRHPKANYFSWNMEICSQILPAVPQAHFNKIVSSTQPSPPHTTS